MKQSTLLLPLLAAALLASCASNEWGHATVRTKSAPMSAPVRKPLPPTVRPAAVRPAPAPAVSTPAPVVRKPAPAVVAAPPATQPEPKPRPRTPLMAPSAQNSPIGCPTPKPAVRSQRPTPPQNNPQLHRKSYPTMPGQNRGLQSLSAQRGY